MKFDVFLSHNSKDKPAVEQIAHWLEKKGLKVWLDKWNLVPGDPWQEDLEDALDDSQTVAVFVGAHNISPWENEEMRSAIQVRVQDKTRRVIPVLLPGAPDSRDLKLPRFLQRLTWVDLRVGIENEDALYRLECGIKGIAPGKSPGVESKLDFAELPPPADLPSGSYLPFGRNPLFTGREAELKSIAVALLNQNSGAVIHQAVAGMGGLGKTQLALEFGYRYGRFFRGVHWLNMANAAAFLSEVTACGAKMGLPNFPDDFPSQLTLTLNTWKANGPRLLILDNFEDVTRVTEVMGTFNHSNLRVLVTSRHFDWMPTSGLRTIPLDVFTPEESLRFLRLAMEKRNDSDSTLSLLAQKLGHLPLALELASRYLSRHPRLNIPAYLEQAREAIEHPAMQNWRKDLPSATAHDLDLQSTFALSWKELLNTKGEEGGRVALSDSEGRIETTAQKIFQAAGYLAPNAPIPFEVFEKTFDLTSETCDEALNLLFGLGLFKQEDNAQPSIHPLLAEYARHLLGDDKTILESLADVFSTLSKEAIDTGLPARFASIEPHVPILAEFAEAGEMESAGTLWNSYGYYLNIIADYSGARAAYERALKLDPENAICINNLGEVMRQSGDLAGARTAFERALQIEPEDAAYVNNLGEVMRQSGDLAGARTAFERALQIDEAAFGLDHPNVARDVNNLGVVMQDMGDLAGAHTAFERALKIDEAAFGADHPKVAIRVNNLGRVMQDMGDLAGARTMCERALKIDEVAFGLNHPNVARDVNNLGEVMRQSGDLAGARTAFERALQIFEANLGVDHPNIATLINNLGEVMRQSGDLAGARTAFERALQIFEANLGVDHPNVATLVNNLGVVMKAMGDLASARTMYERALKIDEAAFGTDHPSVARDVNNLGSVMKAMGDLAGARTMYERALKIKRKFYPPDHPSIKLTQGNLDSLG